MPIIKIGDMPLHNRKVNKVIMKVSRKYMFQKIKFLLNNKYFTMEVQDPIGKRRKMDIQIAKGNNLYIERSLRLLMRQIPKIMKVSRNSQPKKEQVWNLYCKGWKQTIQKFIIKLLDKMKILKKTRMMMRASFFKEECHLISSMMSVEISRSIKMISQLQESEEKFWICLMSSKSQLIRITLKKSYFISASSTVLRSSSLWDIS